MRHLLAWLCIMGFAISDIIGKAFEKNKKQIDYKVHPDPLWLMVLIIWRYPRRLLNKLGQWLYNNLP